MTKMQVPRKPPRLSEDGKSATRPAVNRGNDKSASEVECRPSDDSSEACSSQQDLETQLASCMTTVLSESHVKTNGLVWPPLPASSDNGWNIFPAWIAVSIVILSIVGILGAIVELRYQFSV